MYIYNLKWYNYALHTNYTLSIPISIGNHTHSSPIWEIIVLAILKIVRGEAEYNF